MIVLAYDPNNVKPGLLAFFIVAALGAATYFLVRSMNKQIGKIDLGEDAERAEAPTRGAPPARSAGEAPSDGPSSDRGP